MNPPPKSRSYRLAKSRLSHRPTKPWIALWSGLTLMWFGLAIWDDGGRTMNLILGVMFLSVLYGEWEMTGHRELHEEQRQLLEEARSKPSA